MKPDPTMSTYLILGATGNTGKPIAQGLLDKGHTVRILVRDATKAKELTDQGAVLFQGDAIDSDLLKRALAGADAAYFLVPPSWGAEDFTAHQREHVDAFIQALRGSGVKHVVTLSSIGAHLAEGNGVVQGLHYMEQALNGIAGLNTLHLRSTYFMENNLGGVGMVKNMGMMGGAVRPDLKLPMVATRDVAAKALDHLLKLDFTGHDHEYVLGPREVTLPEVAGVLGAAIGQPDLKYAQFPYDQAAQGMMQMGASASMAQRMMEFVECLNSGKILEEARRDAVNTTPTDIKEFAPVFKAVYEMN